MVVLILNDGLANNVIMKEGFFGISGTDTMWIQNTNFPCMYSYRYNFPDVEGYKFLLGFANFAWTNSNDYQDILMQNRVTTFKENLINVCFKEQNVSASGPLYFVGIYIKS